ncbi:MAG: hypothetical protein DRI44_05960 [Chlamydiae bacterium]|nr:MAG: hypothetical protein DRI44_05960 [Chlamydiota bacterium]
MENNISKLLFVFLISIMFLTGCEKAENGNNKLSSYKTQKIKIVTNVITKTVKIYLPAEPTQEVVKTKNNQSPKQLVLTSNIIAYVDGSPVKLSQFNAVFANRDLEKLPTYLRREYDKNRDNFIKQLINNKVFESAANNESFSDSPEFNRELDDVVKQVKMKYYYDKYITSRINISEKDIKNYYKNHDSKYSSPEKIKVRHILIAVKKNPLPVQITNAYNKAKLLRQRVMEGESFAEIAAAESDCPSRAKGGDLGYRQRGQLVPEFEKVAFDLKKNEISKVIKTEFGYHIIQVTDIIQKRKLSFDEVKDKIKQEIYSQREKKLYNDLLTSLTNKYKVIKNDKIIKQLTGKY